MVGIRKKLPLFFSVAKTHFIRYTTSLCYLQLTSITPFALTNPASAWILWCIVFSRNSSNGNHQRLLTPPHAPSSAPSSESVTSSSTKPRVNPLLSSKPTIVLIFLFPNSRRRHLTHDPTFLLLLSLKTSIF